MRPQNQSSRLGTTSRLALFGGLLLAGIAAPPVAVALGTASVGGALGAAIAGGIGAALPTLLSAGTSWLVNKLAAEDGPLANGVPKNKSAALLDHTETIGQAVGEAIFVLTTHIKENPRFAPNEATNKSLESFGSQAAENVKWFFTENPPTELEHLSSASLPELIGASGVHDILDSSAADRLITELEARSSGRLPEPARTELIRLCTTRLSEALVGVFAHHLVEGDHSFAGFQIEAQAETLAIVRGLQQAAQIEFPKLHDAIQTAVSEVTRTVRREAEATRAVVASGNAQTSQKLDQLERLLRANEYAEASAILQKVILEAEQQLKRHQTEEAAKLLAIFLPHITDRLEIQTRARFYGILGQIKLESDELEGARIALKTSLELTYTSQATVHYHAANLKIEGSSRAALESLKEAVRANPDDVSLASIYASTLSTRQLQEFQMEAPAPLLQSPIFWVNVALTYSRRGDHELALATLDSVPTTARTKSVENWAENLKLGKLLSQLQKKNAARLLPTEETEFSALMASGIVFLESLSPDYDDVLFEQQLNAVFAGRKYLRDREKANSAIVKTAASTRNQVALLYASRVALEYGDFVRALELIDFQPSAFIRGQPAWYVTALEVYGTNEDQSRLRALRDEAASMLAGELRPAEELVIPLYQALLACAVALGEDPSVLANPERFAELFPASAATILGLAFLTDVPCRALLSGEALQHLESSVNSEKWGHVSLWIDVLRKLGCTDDILKVARTFDQSVASEHLLKSLQVAFQTQNEEFALTTLHSLYEAGYRDVDLSCNFVHALYWHEPNRAMSIVQELASLHPTSLDIHLLLCQLAGLELQHDAVCLPNPIPEEWLACTGERRHGILLGLLMEDRIEEAEELAFNHYLRYPNDAFAQQGIVNLFLPFLQGEHRQITVPTNVESVRAGCYVSCFNRMSRSVQDFWVATGRVEDAVQPALSEIDPLYSQLIGKEVGDKITLDRFTSLEIQAIKDWRLELFHRAMSQLSSSVAEPKLMWKISVQSEDPAKEFDFTSLIQMMDDRRSEVQQVMSLGRSQPFPAHAFAGLLDSDLAVAWKEATQAGDMPRTMQGDLVRERDLAKIDLSSNRPFLLDETALLSIFLFGLEEQLLAVFDRLRICSFARRSVAAWERNTSLFFAHIAFRTKTLPFGLFDLADYNERLRAFRTFLANIEEFETKIFPGKGGEYRKKMVNVFGRPACQTMSAALASGASIVCDDAVAKGLMQSEVAVQGFSTFSLIAALGVQKDAWKDLCAQAIMVGYGGTPLDADIAVRVYERLGWAPDHGGDRLLLESLKSWHRSDSRACANIALILESVFLRCGVSELRRRLAYRFLSGVFDRLQDGEKIGRLHRALQLKARTGIHLITTEEAAKVVDDWRRQI